MSVFLAETIWWIWIISAGLKWHLSLKKKKQNPELHILHHSSLNHNLPLPHYFLLFASPSTFLILIKARCSSGRAIIMMSAAQNAELHRTLLNVAEIDSKTWICFSEPNFFPLRKNIVMSFPAWACRSRKSRAATKSVFVSKLNLNVLPLRLCPSQSNTTFFTSGIYFIF